MLPSNRRIIVALDVPDLAKGRGIVQELGDRVGSFKVGQEFITAQGSRNAINMVHKAGGDVFYDMKFVDIPNTVRAASREVTQLGVKMFNVFCAGGKKMMQAARQGAEDGLNSGAALMSGIPVILGVTVLTSMDYHELARMRMVRPLGMEVLSNAQQKMNEAVADQVRVFALLAQEAGLAGVIASPQEIEVVRKACGPDFLIVTPGVRPQWAPANDQKRIMSPGDAIRAGADYLVIGRPITAPPKEVGGSLDALRLIENEIEEAESKR